MAHGRLDQGFRCRLAIFALQILLQRAGIHPDTNRDVVVAGGTDHRPHTLFLANVAGIEAQAVDAELGHTQSDLVVEVDIGHQRYLDLVPDTAKSFSGIQ